MQRARGHIGDSDSGLVATLVGMNAKWVDTVSHGDKQVSHGTGDTGVEVCVPDRGRRWSSERRSRQRLCSAWDPVHVKHKMKTNPPRGMYVEKDLRDVFCEREDANGF